MHNIFKMLIVLLLMTQNLSGCDMKSIKNPNQEIKEINVDGTILYVIKQRWGISGGSEATLVTSRKEDKNFKKIEEGEERIICFSIDTFIEIEKNKVYLSCPTYSISDNQIKSIEIEGVEVIIKPYKI